MTKVLTRVAVAALCIASLSASVVAGSIPGDLVFPRKGDVAGFSPAYFPHWVHRIKFKCYACHDDIFQMKLGADPITMEAMAKGNFCGKCHNGKVAFNVDTCNRCHLGQ